MSCNYHGLGFLATVLVSGSLSHTVFQLHIAVRQAIITIQHRFSSARHLIPWTLSTALLDISRTITGSTALLCINSALSLSLLCGFLKHFLHALSPFGYGLSACGEVKIIRGRSQLNRKHSWSSGSAGDEW